MALPHTYVTSIGRLVGAVTLQFVRAACVYNMQESGPVMKYTCSSSPPQLTDAIEGKKKPSREEADIVTLEMVQMAETNSEVENPL